MLEVSGLNVYYDNIRALKEIIEPDIATDDIYVTLCSPWVPTDVIDDFILHLVKLDRLKNGDYPKAAKPFLTSGTRCITTTTPVCGKSPKRPASANPTSTANTRSSTTPCGVLSAWIC